MAAVWRNAGSPGALESGSRSAQVDAIPDDDSCDICMGEDGACDIWFSPCGHKACASCVQKMRIANVYKADKGVRCPFCRQVIESYLDSPPSRRPANSPFPPESASFTLLMGGNSEQGSKAIADTSVKKPYGRGGIVSIGGGNDYTPPKGVTGSDGGGLRLSTRTDDLLPGYIVPPLKDTDDIVSMAMDRTGARHLDFMLRDGYSKRHKVAKLCREMLTPFAAKLAVHASGNYVLQRMLEYAATHRGEGGNSESFFTAIVRSFCQDRGLVMAAQDHRGTFSVQKMLVSLKGTEEASLVATCIRGSVVQLALDQFGVYVLERLVEAMITSLNPAPGKKPRIPSKIAMKTLAQICEEIHTDPASLASIAKHQMSGIMLVECIRWALPQSEALTAALSLANMSGDLIGSKLSHRTLQGVLTLEVKEVAEHVIQGLQGHYVELASDTLGFGFKLVRACLATPCVGEDMRLLVVNELLDGFNRSGGHYFLIEITAACDTLAFGLCLLSRRDLNERLEKLSRILDRDKYILFRERVENMRKQFFNETPPLNNQHVAVSAPPTPPVSTITRARSLDISSRNCGNDTGSNSFSGNSRAFHGQPVSDPWSEEAPSGGVFSLEHIEKPLVRVVSMPHARSSTPGSRLASPEHHISGESSRGVENSTTNTMASSSSGSLVGRSSWNQGGSSTSTPPHLRDKNVSAGPGQSGIASSHSHLPSLEGRLGSYAPLHLRHSNSFSATSPPGLSESRNELGSPTSGEFGNGSLTGNSPRGSSDGHSLLPYGSSDFLDYISDPVESPTAAVPKNASEQDLQTESVKSTGSQRQPGICAVCNRDAANTVLLNCSHMCCCTVCSRAVKLCPICNNKVSSVIDIRLVGTLPSSSLPTQNGASNAWDRSALTNSVSSISSNLVDIYNGAVQFREGTSRPSSSSSQYHAGDPAGFEGSAVKVGNQHYPFRQFSPDQPPPGIPVPKQSSAQSVSASLRSTSPKTIAPTNVTTSGTAGRPLFLPSDFFSSGMSVNGTATSNFPSLTTTASSFNQHLVPLSPGSSASTTANGSAVNLPGVGALTSSTPQRRVPAPYRPPGLYRPPDLFARPAPAAVAQTNNSSVMSDFANMVPSQWRTYQ
ncbi:uncharacterized protein [Physcomitrium patens]|uniref:RING-type domain-containing protein n=1 Tax=Physcomitrium patens TaxID=3218 RepID=A0A2K1J4K3_PHYPA|nr:uncharacterized protein LOC112294485 isoform X2 [Physcomitrium patens]PNR36459.1 hypothetical protein PHYPA_022310 [Physcomitrium patens]|eukprot:XP_024400728.1 uncharacterized protein LOC112294485 isoform X2 [Physcomitrella patens]